eukprot:5124202-Prymnesium_polylepis.1
MECAWTCVPSFAVAGLGCSALFVRAHECVIREWPAGHARVGMDMRSVGSGRGRGCVGPSLGAASAAPLWGVINRRK